MVEEAADLGRRHADDRGQILPGAKRPPGAGDEERAAALVTFGRVERGHQRLGHLGRQRVEPLRPVERDHAILGVGFNEDRHRLALPLQSGWFRPMRR